MLLFLESPNLLPWSVARAKVDKKPGRSACSGALSLATRTKQENPYLYMVSLTASQTLICQKQRNMQDIWGAPTGTPDSLQRAVHHLMLPVWSKLIIPASFLAYLTVFFFRLHSLCWCPFGSMSHIVCSHSSLWTELLANHFIANTWRCASSAVCLNTLGHGTKYICNTWIFVSLNYYTHKPKTSETRTAENYSI